MEHTKITQRVVDAAALILATAATNIEQTGCQTTSAFAVAETRAAETYRLTTAELALSARLATRAAFTAGAYTINAMTDRAIRTAALRKAIRHIDTYQLQDQPCSTESEPHSPEPQPARPTRVKTSSGSAKHSAPRADGWRRFASYLSRISIASTGKPTDADHHATTA